MPIDPLSHEHTPFVRTPQINEILGRTLGYLRAGLAVHLRGRAGTGKTTLAIMAAQMLRQPMVILYGNNDYLATDLLGERVGYRRRLIYDNYIHNVKKTEDEMLQRWVDSRLSQACKEGWILIYDEFNRSRPETNNTLLSILEERLLDYPVGIVREPVPVHDDFKAIFTSNPDEYAGVHPAQDALLDRMITINLDCYDEETELAIAAARADAKPAAILPLIRAVRTLREAGEIPWPSLRTSIMLARAVTTMDIPLTWKNDALRHLFRDVILGRLPRKQAKASEPVLEEAGHRILP